MPEPKPMSESAVRIPAISVRSAASRLRSFASSLAMLVTTGLSLIGRLPFQRFKGQKFFGSFFQERTTLHVMMGVYVRPFGPAMQIRLTLLSLQEPIDPRM